MEAIQDVRSQLKQRLALARPADTCRGIFFNGVLEGVKTFAGVEVEARCREATGQQKFVDFFSYPVSGFIQMALTALDLLAPRLGSGEGVLRWMGEQSTVGFLNTIAGKTAFMLASGNVKRLISQLPISYKAAVSYGERTVVWTGEHSGCIVFKRDFMPPAYHEGVIFKALERLKVRGVQIHGRATGPLDTEYEMTWQEPPAR
jgi:uncharacterized protein (TIGR02265 family)